MSTKEKKFIKHIQVVKHYNRVEYKFSPQLMQKIHNSKLNKPGQYNFHQNKEIEIRIQHDTYTGYHKTTALDFIINPKQIIYIGFEDQILYFDEFPYWQDIVLKEETLYLANTLLNKIL